MLAVLVGIKVQILTGKVAAGSDDAVGRALNDMMYGTLDTGTKVLALLVQMYLLYWYKSTNNDALNDAMYGTLRHSETR